MLVRLPLLNECAERLGSGAIGERPRLDAIADPVASFHAAAVSFLRCAASVAAPRPPLDSAAAAARRLPRARSDRGSPPPIPEAIGFPSSKSNIAF